MIWSNESGEWKVVKKFKGEDWSEIDFSYEHKTACPVLQIFAGDLK